MVVVVKLRSRMVGYRGDDATTAAAAALIGTTVVRNSSLVIDGPVAPVAYQVILEPGIRQFREFESPRVHTPINS